MCGKVKRLTPENTDSEADYSESELYNMNLMRDELESDSDEFEQDGAYMCHTTKVTDDHNVSEVNTEVTDDHNVSEVNDTSEVNHISDDATVIGTEEERVQVNNIKTKIITVELGIKDQKVKFELDTGSPYTMISEETMKKVGGQLSETKIKIKSYTGHPVHISGETYLDVKYRNQVKKAKMLVTKLQPDLIGRDLISELDIITVNHIQDEVKSLELKTLLESHKQVFDSKLGKLKDVQAKIYVGENVKPIYYKARPLPYAMRTKVDTELKRLEENGIIEPVRFSDWAAPVVPVLKPNGDMRLCGDYKVMVNRVSKLEHYPIPTLEDLTTKLAHGTVYHKLDLSHAYLQVELDPESRKYVTVNTHKGLYQYTRLPFGISSAPAIFQRVIESVLRGIPSVAIYLDDILVTGTSVRESLKNLNSVLQRLEEAGLRLKQEKCEFMAETVTYLGHKVSKAGITPVADKVRSIVEAQPPENVTQLKAYLGMLNYYGRFLKQLSHELHPLHQLLRKDTKWKWGNSQQQCFEKSKKMITSAKVLAHYNPELQLVLQCDASTYGLGAVLSHIMPDGSERPIGFVSRTLNIAEKKYAQIDKEGAAIIFGLKKFHCYLLEDHSPS